MNASVNLAFVRSNDKSIRFIDLMSRMNHYLDCFTILLALFLARHVMFEAFLKDILSLTFILLYELFSVI